MLLLLIIFSFQAWALEQGAESKHAFSEQDTMVKWTLNKRFLETDQTQKDVCEKELASTCVDRRAHESTSSMPTNNFISPDGACKHVTESAAGDLIFQRYCHVYREGELEDLCSTIPGMMIDYSR
jgi:hypothetical protein